MVKQSKGGGGQANNHVGRKQSRGKKNPPHTKATFFLNSGGTQQPGQHTKQAGALQSTSRTWSPGPGPAAL